MKIDIKTSHIDLTPPLREYILEKVGTLEKFVGRWEHEGEAEVWVEIDRTTEHHHKGKVFRAVIDLRLPHQTLRVTEFKEDARAAVDRAKDVMKLEIAKYKTKNSPTR